MESKGSIRKRYLFKRKKRYFEVKSKIFNPLFELIKKKNIKKKIVSLYYPTNYELNVFKIFENEYFKRFKPLLPIVKDKDQMHFYEWKKKDLLSINKYGILEPLKSKIIVPTVILVPLLAYDNQKNRLGYGKGFYDKFLKKFIDKYKNILTVGIAFSFQKHQKLPINQKDVNLNYILTEKGIF